MSTKKLFRKWKMINLEEINETVGCEKPFKRSVISFPFEWFLLLIWKGIDFP